MSSVPRTRKGHNVGDPAYRPAKGPNMVRALAQLQGTSESTAKKRAEKMFWMLNECAHLARSDADTRAYLARKLAPIVAACIEPTGVQDRQALVHAYARADADSDVLLLAWLADPTEENWLRFRASLHQERNRGAELEATVEAIR